MVGRVVNAAIERIRRVFIDALPVGLVIGVIMSLLGLWFARLLSQLDTDLAAGDSTTAGELLGNVFLGVIAAIVIGQLLQAVILNMVIQDDRGEELDVARALSATLSRFGSLFGLVLIIAAAVFVGLILFIAPGIYIAIAMVPAIPALFAERLTAGQAFRRSRELVRGRWWQVFGVVIVFAIFNTIIEVLGRPAGIVGFLGEIVATALTAIVQQAASYELYKELAAEKPPAPLERPDDNPLIR